MVRKGRMAFRVLLILFLAAAIVYALKFSGDSTISEKSRLYDITSPSSEKFQMVARWIPAECDFYASVDAWRLFEDPLIGAAIISKLQNEGGAAADLLKGLLAKGDSVGLFSAAILPASGDSPSNTIFIIQGDFKKEKIVSDVRAALGEEESFTEILDEKSGISTFCEDGVDESYCFRFLDDIHMAVASISAFERVSKKLPRDVSDEGSFPVGVIYGYLRLSPEISKFFGADDGGRTLLYFLSQNGKRLTATLSAADATAAKNLKDALEGLRALLILENPGDHRLASLLERVSIESEGTHIRISTNIIDLLMR
ncbi:MAG: hypothetical protein BWY40_00269 [bacterium ADurb.Bin270]|nr:hypothetical protein [Myxococcales bacterium]OQA62089.1 MAG: hypothetical protein BWY40_00269 [bacterium ADurb.Bin270]HQG13029.1 hypothetical protein [bacterium]HQH79970.1 hypothetical protein [bacterium]